MASAFNDGPHDFVTRGIAQGMYDAAMAVSPFAREGNLAVLFIEMRAPANQVRDLLRCFAHDQLDNFPVTQASARG